MRKRKAKPAPSSVEIEEPSGCPVLLPTDATDVHAYWKARFGEYPSDGSLRELPVSSGCGVPCCAAIDAAALLVAHIQSAFGDENSSCDCDGSCECNNRGYRAKQVIDSCFAVVRCYWHG